MNIQERMDSINGVIKNIAEFIQTHEDIKTDFNEYLRTIGATTKTGIPLQTACFSYILERNLGEDLKSIPQLYLENTKGLDKDTKNVVEAIDESISSNMSCMASQIAALNSLTKLVVPNASICPGWGDVTGSVTPATAGA